MTHRQSSERPDVSDCLALVSRADVHLKSLNRLLSRFRKSGAYEVRAHVDPDTVPQSRPAGPGFVPLGYPIGVGPGGDRKETVITGHVLADPPSRQAGLLVADTVNNLRAALDHLVWLLSIVENTPPSPMPKDSIWRKVGWPIILKDTAWPPNRAEKLRFVDHAVWTQFERLQPFARRQNEPERDEFAVLDELWNVYKHRHLPLTQFGVGIQKVASRLGQLPPGLNFKFADAQTEEAVRKLGEKHSYTIISERPWGPFEDGAELGRVREAGPVYSVRPDMDVDPSFAIDVAFAEGPPAYGERVTELLRRIRTEVRTAIMTFA